MWYVILQRVCVNAQITQLAACVTHVLAIIIVLNVSEMGTALTAQTIQPRQDVSFARLAFMEMLQLRPASVSFLLLKVTTNLYAFLSIDLLYCYFYLYVYKYRLIHTCRRSPPPLHYFCSYQRRNEYIRVSKNAIRHG